jgi:UDP-N-acetylmuramoylalanine--D-glutamate ligase
MSRAPSTLIPPTGSTAGRTLVLGMGATGAACARYLAASGSPACFADSRPAPPQLATIRALLPAAELCTGGIPAQLPAAVTQIVISPGVPLDLPLLAEARARGVPCSSDIDLFASLARAPVLGITGSNGKSTVTTMAGHLLAAVDAGVAVGGNLGTPALDLLAADIRLYVLELSSFQLERSQPLPLRAATILNITPDHLDLHGDMAAYARAKGRIWAAAEVVVVNRDAPETHGLIPPGATVSGYGLGVPRGDDFGIGARSDGPWLMRGTTPLLPAAALPVAGRHNASNALAALALVAAAGMDPVVVAPALRSYRALPHRMAVVPTTDGITWIDDSKATNVGAAETAIRSTSGPLVLIAGGDAKGASFEGIAAALADRPAVAILLGRDREQLAVALATTCRVERVADMPEAVRRARSLATQGATVLLAPACSSLDMFRDYADRGAQFQAAVLAGAAGPAAAGGAGR